MQLITALFWVGFGNKEKTKSFKSATEAVEQLPSDSQLPKQCCIMVSDAIVGRTLSLKLEDTPHG